MYKFYLIYEYHDLFIESFDSYEHLQKFLLKLKEEYKFDSDFRYHIIVGMPVLESVIM